MGTVVERIPNEIWFYISTFLPRDTVKNLYAVNRSFFTTAIAAEYRVLTFSKHDKRTKRLLQHLSEFDRGAFVREVIIEPWLVQPSLKLSYKRGASLWASISGLLDPGSVDRQMEHRVRNLLEKDIRRVTDAISAMPQLYNYSLRWKDDLPYHPELYRAFLSPVLSCIKFNLRSLTLNVPPEMMHVMPSIDMPHLESLSVDLCTQTKSEEEIDRIFDSLVVFVNNLLESLELLSIASRVPSRSLKLDRFFRMLGTFPHLRSFSLSIPFDGNHLSSPEQVVKFLNKHRHMLKHLRLNASRCSPVDSPVGPECKLWIPNTLTRLNMTPYPQLYDLHLAIRPIMMDLSPLMKFFGFHAIDSLTLTERSLTYDEVQAILDALSTCEHSRGLKQLRLRIKYLSPDLLELLAKRIPRLALLELVFGRIRHSEQPGPIARDEFRLFVEEIRKKSAIFAPWELVTFKLLQEPSYGLVEELLKVIADCIPGLQNYVDLTTRDF